MAAHKPESSHEELHQQVEQAQREVLPSVKLEKKEIRMKITPPSPSRQDDVPSIVMTTIENGKGKNESDTDKIVGITIATPASLTAEPPDPHYDRLVEVTTTPTTTSVTPSSPKITTRHNVSMEKTENLMEYFEDKKNTQMLAPRPASRTPRTPSPSPLRQSIGLDHLDNLVKLMEQLGNLRDENQRLKTRCDYLESTKTLLMVKSNLEDGDGTMLRARDSNSIPRTSKPKTQIKSTSSEGSGPRILRPRLPSAEDAKCIELTDSPETTIAGRRKLMFKRSFSTGSLEVPSDIMEHSEDDIDVQRLSDPFEEKLTSSKLKSPEIKQKSKFSKWAKVKKVLTKQQLSENISSGIKSIKGLGKGAYLRYGSIAGRELTVPSHSVAESRSVDSGVGSGMDGELQDVRRSTSSNEPPSPTRFTERHIDVPTPQVDDCEGIWLGPPEWIEKEREKEKEILLKQSALCESERSESDIGSPHSVSGYEANEENVLQIPIPRRQSTPLFLDSEDDDDVTDSDLKRTSSCKEKQQVSKAADESFHKSDKPEKKYKTPWGKMKNIIHTGRKDSVKKKSRKGAISHDMDSGGFEEVSETDFDNYDDIKYALEGPVSRSTPKASPIVFRQKQTEKSSSNSPPEQRAAEFMATGPGSIDVSALLGGVSDEFTRKLQKWEEIKEKRSSGQFKEQSPEFCEGVSHESVGTVSPEFLKKLEEWEKLKSVKGGVETAKKRDSQVVPESDTSSDEAEELSTSPDRGTTIDVQEMQRKLTDTFTRKMEEWERQKSMRSSSVPTKHIPQAKPTRQKSKKTKEEKEREKIEKMREREILRVEREQQKLEKERIRIEKERLKALEREAKIEKMKGRLSQPDIESKFKNPVLGPLTEYKVTADFARKLHEWEVMKGKEGSTAMYFEAQKRSLQFSQEYQNATNILSTPTNENAASEISESDEPQMRKTSSESDDIFLLDDNYPVEPKPAVPPAATPLMLVPTIGSSEKSASAPVSDDSSLDDHSTETFESMTQANIASLEKANSRLLEELRQKELEYNSLQDEVRVLNDRLITFRNKHVLELDLYKQQLIEDQTPGYVTFDTKHMTQTLMNLEDKIGEIKKFGEQLAMSMEGAAVGKFQTVEGEESINMRLVDLLDKMRLLLQQATLSGENTLEEVSKKSSALHNFEKLYSQAMQLQMQMNNLRLSQLERNKEIMNMKRHLLLQEANNLLLQADVTRREAELLYYKEYSQKRVPIKRWNTYSGKEDRAREPLPESSQKQSIFQRVQRLRSARAPISSTTDSDSDIATKTPPRRESPRVRKRESPNTRKKQSPAMKRKESSSPKLRPKDAAKYRRSPEECVPECSTDRREEIVEDVTAKKVISDKNAKLGKQTTFSSVILPTARLTLPVEFNQTNTGAVPKTGKDRKESAQMQSLLPLKEVSEEMMVKDIEVLTRTKPKHPEPKFPELLIPEWKKQSHRTSSESSENHSEQAIELDLSKCKTDGLVRFKSEENDKLAVDRSFDSSETSEDTLKYMTPEPSPAMKTEKPVFPAEVKLVKQQSQDPMETASDPGQSRPNSIVRVTIETHGTPLLLRKAQTGQQLFGRGVSRVNIPITPLKQIKPAQELLDESQKYRSGHSIYLTRILKRYPMKIECRSRNIDKSKANNEEVTEGYVKQMIKQLSREGTPDSIGSPKLRKKSIDSLNRTELPRQKFVSQIVENLSSPTELPTEKRSSPPRTMASKGKVQRLKQMYDSSEEIPGRRYSETLIVKKYTSDDVMHTPETAKTTILTAAEVTPNSATDIDDGTLSKANYVSMPMLSLEGTGGGRERSATTSSPSVRSHSHSPKDSPLQKHKLHVAISMSPNRSRRVIDPNLSPARMRRLIDPASPGRRRRQLEQSSIEMVKEEPEVAVAQIKLSQPLGVKKKHSPKVGRKEKSKMGTIEILCRQSMAFNLGVSVQGQEKKAGSGSGASSSPSSTIRHSTSSTASVDSGELEGATGHDEKKKSRRKTFMDSSFIQKSKKFFKVSKPSPCSSLECCGSDRQELKKSDTSTITLEEQSFDNC